MTSGVNGIGGNPYNYGSYGYNNRQAKESHEEAPQVQTNVPESKNLNPDAVMDFMNKYIYMAPETQKTGNSEIDPETKQRIEGFMEQFQMFYSIIEQEFGSELAPDVMDMVMDNLMGMM